VDAMRTTRNLWRSRQTRFRACDSYCVGSWTRVGAGVLQLSPPCIAIAERRLERIDWIVATWLETDQRTSRHVSRWREQRLWDCDADFAAHDL
jgi:hypothetical protein